MHHRNPAAEAQQSVTEEDTAQNTASSQSARQSKHALMKEDYHDALISSFYSKFTFNIFTACHSIKKTVQLRFMIETQVTSTNTDVYSSGQILFKGRELFNN